MEELTLSEASLFLLLLSANFERDPVTGSIQGELSEDAEQFILKCINKFVIFREVSSQKQLEDSIEKYNDLKDIFCTTTAEIIQHCAKPLLKYPMDRDIVYCLCNKIIFSTGNIDKDSKEDKYLSKMNYYLKIDSAFADTVGFLEMINNTLKS